MTKFYYLTVSDIINNTKEAQYMFENYAIYITSNSEETIKSINPALIRTERIDSVINK